MKGLKIVLPLLVALSLALGPAFLPRSPQEALAAQAKPEPPVKPDPLATPATAPAEIEVTGRARR
jgi:hypothetical protein